MTASEDRLREQFAEIKAMGDKDKNIDVAALMTNALDSAQREEANRRSFKRAYWVSFLFPPLGLGFALYYLLSGREGGRRAALWCVLLTVLPGVLTFALMGAFVGSLGPDVTSQLQSVNVQDYQDLLQ